jgi:uncharacterized protein (DUF1015 family)
MTIIKPFRGYRYDPAAVGRLSRVITPPYDVINKDQQSSYYRSHPYNFIRLDLGKTFPSDGKNNNRYIRAGRFLEEWIGKGILAKEDRECVYVYGQRYRESGRLKERLGFISLARLVEDRTKGFLPHERTFKGPKLDRLNLMKETSANLSPIFSIVFDDNKKIIKLLKAVAKGKPALDVDFEGTRNRIWLMTDAKQITLLKGAMAKKKALIADGHHRYEVALEYRRHILKAKKEAVPGAYDYVMMYFATSDPAGLTILPTHRMVEGISAARLRKDLEKINKYFDIIEAGSRRAMLSCMKAGRKRHAIGVYLGGRDYRCLRLKREDAGAFIDSKNSSYWRNLDVVILHHLVFEKALGIKGHKAERMVTFTRDAEEAFDWAASGGGRASFFLNPPGLKDINNIVKSRERMPHKTTYFYPKPPSGLVINRLG